MRIFVTGATGFIGSAVVHELIDAGHQVLGLARSDAGVKALVSAGAEVHRGHLEDLESLRQGAATTDAVIHTAFIHDFTKYHANCEIDRHAIEALGSALLGSKRRLIITSGVGFGTLGNLANEEDRLPATFPRSASEQAGDMVASRGVHVSVVRLPQVHDIHKQGLITYLIEIARQKGVSAYIGDGANRYPAVHLLDAVSLYKLVLEKGEPEVRYNAVAEQGVSAKEIAEVIGRRLNIPVVSKSAEEAADHFGWFGLFVGVDLAASSALTQERLGWKPTQRGLILDLNEATDLSMQLSH